jgi:hypothetical protein
VVDDFRFQILERLPTMIAGRRDGLNNIRSLSDLATSAGRIGRPSAPEFENRTWFVKIRHGLQEAGTVY